MHTTITARWLLIIRAKDGSLEAHVPTLEPCTIQLAWLESMFVVTFHSTCSIFIMQAGASPAPLSFSTGLFTEDTSRSTHNQSVPRLTLRTNPNLQASLQRPPFPEQRCNAYCTSPAQANLIFTSANASTCRSRSFGRAYSRIFPALRSTRTINAMYNPRPPSHGSILVSRIVADDKEQAS
jgi:hypothetical protein